MMDTVVTNGTVVTATETYQADIGLEEGKIAALGRGLGGVEIIDAQGKYVFPGAIDVHTHFELPSLGTVSADDFETGSIAAACGGTTTFIDFADQGKGESLHQALEIRMERAKGKAAIDYGFHVAITDMTDEVMNVEMAQMVEQGVTSFKLYMAYKGTYMADDETLFKSLLKAKELGALIMVHAENGDLLHYLINKHVAEGKKEPIWHARSHPPEAEAEATGRAIILAALAGAPIYIAHLSTAQALEKVKEARDKGQPVLAETCPQYLFFNTEHYKLPNFEGAKYVISPPLREKGNGDCLWKGLASGDLQVVSTDHCSFNFVGQKDMGRDDFSKIPNGMPGVETRVPLIYHFGVNEGRFSINRFVELVSTNPARLFGLAPEKGTISIGADADLVIFDPQKEVRLSVENLHMNVDHSPYGHITVRGYPVMVMQRGKVIVKDGQFVGQVGAGQFLRRRRIAI
jgi:dihydropyrimidinase